MQASVLLDDSTTVYAYDVPVREGLLNDEGPGGVELETSGSDKDIELMRKLLSNS